MTMEIVGNDAQFNEKVTLLKDLEIYGNIKNKTKDTSFDFSDDLSFKIQGNEKLRITPDGATGDISAHTLNVVGVSTFNDDVVFKGNTSNARWDHSTNDLILFDNTRLEFGSNKDFEIWHGGSHTFMKNSGGDLRIRGDVIKLATADGSERYLEANGNNAVQIFHNGNERFTTTSTGVVITGICTATDGVAYGSGMGATISSPATNTLTLGTNGAERLRIDSDGKLIQHSGDIPAGTLPYAYFSLPTSSYGGVDLTMNLHDTASEAIGNGGGLGFSAIGVSGNPVVRAAIRGNTEATSSEAGYLTLHTRTNGGGNDERLRITSAGNVGIGSNAPTSKLDVQGFVTASNTPKAFVNFDGTTNTGGNCTIRDSHNVSSVTDNGTGHYTIIFSTAFANTNYIMTFGHSNAPNNGSTHGVIYTETIATGSLEIFNFNPNGSSDRVDKGMISVVIHAT